MVRTLRQGVVGAGGWAVSAVVWYRNIDSLTSTSIGFAGIEFLMEKFALSLAVGVALGYWNGGLSIGVVAAMYLIFTITNFYGLFIAKPVIDDSVLYGETGKL